MFQNLQRKWKVSGWRLFFILVTFALGGSLCGMAGRWLMNTAGFEKGVLWFILYIILVTLIWPICVLLVSIPLGQFLFFRKYIYKIISRFNSGAGSRQEVMADKYQATGVGHQPVMELNVSNFGQVTRLAIFASGAGSNAKKIIEHFSANPLINIELLVCNKPGAGVIDIANQHGIDVLLINRETFFSGDHYLSVLKQYNIDWIILAGFLWKVPTGLINAYPQKIINIHPALLPGYGGKGMYGNFVHEAVILNKEKESGISIHFVDEVYDHGKIIKQVRCSVEDHDTPTSLAEKIHRLEHEHYPVVIEDLLLKAKSPLNQPDQKQG